MLLQASPDVETLLRQMLARNIALTIDRAAIRGGGANEPKGVLETTGIQTVTAPTSIFEAVAEAVAKADTENVGAIRALLTTPDIRKIAAIALDLTGLPNGVDTVCPTVATHFYTPRPTTFAASQGTAHGIHCAALHDF